MSLILGEKVIAGISREVKYNAHNLLDFKWVDHRLNSMEWLDSTSFSWQSGDVYTSVYNLLVSEYQNGTEETEGNITFKRSPNGYKITTDESGVSALFNETGVAWYYILDTENRRFKLPRSKYNAYASQIAVKGNGKTLSWTNGNNDYGSTFQTSGAWGIRLSENPSATLGESVSETSIPTLKAIGITTDPAKSGIVADLPTQDLHLYFYVGEFSQTATEQTAGITSEILNGKADISASNFNSQGKSLISGLGMPSNRYIDLTLGTSGSTYTAPANGEFRFNLYLPNSSYFAIFNGDTSNVGELLDIAISSIAQNYTIKTSIRKGQIIRIQYLNYSTNNSSRFYYAEGEENV